MKISKVVIEGFRAYKNEGDGTFDFSLPNGKSANFISLYAPNGFGKTSFYDAVEWVLTNNIGRFVRDGARSENETFSKSLKKGRTKQYILRNKDISDDAPSQVRVIGEGVDKFKKVTKPKFGRDYQFKKEDPPSDLGSLSDIFLSQEAIDSFLREEKPEAKYTRFMESFGDEDEIYRSNLMTLKRELSLALKISSSEVKRLESIAAIPINLSLFNNINQTISSLIESGETVDQFGAAFDEAHERAVQAVITKRTHELTAESTDKQLALQELLQLLEKAERFFVAKEKVSRDTIAVEFLNQRDQVFAKRIELLANLSGLRRSMAEESVLITELDELISEIAEYEELAQKVKAGKEQLALIEQKILEYRVKTAGYIGRSEQCQKTISEIDVALANLLSLQQNAPLYYRQILVMSTSIEGLDLKKTAKFLQADALKAKLLAQKETLEKVIAVDVSESGIDKPDAATYFTGFSLLPLKMAMLERQEAASHVQQAAAALKTLRTQAVQFSQLIELGTTLLSRAKTSTCPLCSHDHESHSQLVGKILGNSALSDMEAAALRNQDNFQVAYENVSAKVTALLSEWRKQKDSVISLLQESISADELAFSVLSNELKAIDGELSEARKKLGVFNSNVENLPSEQFASFVAAQNEMLRKNRAIAEKDFNYSNVEIQKLQEDLKDMVQAEQLCSTEIQLCLQNSSYQHIQSFVSANAIAFEDIASFIDKKKSEVNSRIEEQRTALEKKMAELQQIEVSDPQIVIIKKESLASDRIALNASILESNATIFPFVNALVEHLPNYEKDWERWTYEAISKDIQFEVDNINRRIKNNVKNLREYSLLLDQISEVKPYMDSVNAKEKLIHARAILEREKALGAMLDNEYKDVVTRLEARISGFFYVDLINSIYKKIDPHPDFKSVVFKCDFSDESAPRLNVLVSDSDFNLDAEGEFESGDEGDASTPSNSLSRHIVPNLYFSAAQINILSLSIFLARALHVKTIKGEDVKCIFIDDPIHSMDSINVLSTVDLLRTISQKFDRQIILSTHDKNFFELLKKKVPQEEYSSKFIELESFGRVRGSGNKTGNVEINVG
jgi:exonuclease SbcC